MTIRAGGRQRTRVAPPLEKVIQRAIIRALTLAGYNLQKIGNGAVRVPDCKRKGGRFVRLGGKPGFPDLFVVGLAVHLEVKRPGQDLTDDQKLWHADAKRRGAHVFTVYSVEEAFAAVRSVERNQRAIADVIEIARARRSA